MKRMFMLLAALLLAGCDTGQQRRTFPVEVTALPLTGPNEKGWTVEPESLRVSMAPVRFFEGRVLLSERRKPRFDAWALLGVGTAWAHPGHYVPGDALGELLKEAVVVDLLAAEPTVLGEANAVTGSYGSLELTLPRTTFEAPNPNERLAGESVRLVGTATGPEGQRLRFDASVKLNKPVEGIRFEKELGEEPGRVRIAVDLGKWLGRIDFGTVQAPAEGETASFIEGTQAHNALVRGVEDTSAYVVTWEGESK